MSLYGLVSEILFTAAKPFLNRKYDEGNSQRYGYYGAELPRNAIWIHSVSVGEVQSAYPFVKEIKKREPSLPILLSTITKTGKIMSEQLMGGLVNRIYYPWDSPSVLKRALDALAPRAYVTVETEIWPEMLHQLQKRGIPAFLVNGRLSESSFRKYNRFRSFWGAVVRRYTLIMVRSPKDRERFIKLGALPGKVKVTGDCKADALIERKHTADLKPLMRYFAGSRPVILAGSTHEGEEAIVFEAYATLLKKYPDLRLVLVPRHPERAAGLADAARDAGFSGVVLMSEDKTDWNILIVDRIGVLFPIYGCVKAAFMGGSIAPKGGQNIMEPAIWGIPFCQGPDYRDFTEATNALTEAGVCRIVHDASEMARFFEEVLALPDTSEYVASCRAFFASLGGASERSWNLIREYL